MRIRFEPTGPWPADKKVNTNLGEFAVGEERLLMPDQENEGKRLVENGEFVNPDAEAPAPIENIEGAIAGTEDAGEDKQPDPEKTATGKKSKS